MKKRPEKLRWQVTQLRLGTRFVLTWDRDADPERQWRLFDEQHAGPCGYSCYHPTKAAARAEAEKRSRREKAN